jgi:23S rRNA pseudouridine955/2504/2580 synthase
MNKAPKGFVYRMLREKRIKLNNARADGSVILKEGDTVTFYLSDEALAAFAADEKPRNAAHMYDIIFEDANVLIIDKPAGVLTPRDSAHRLDRCTSGIVVSGKNLPSRQWLAKAFRERTVLKTYIAIVSGIFGENTAVYSTDCKESVTEVSVLHYDMNNDRTVLSVRPITGRKHQIRVHLSEAGFPVIGDMRYNGVKSGKGMLLHAYELAFTDSEGFLGYLAGKVFKAPLPSRFDAYADVVRRQR